MQLELIFRAYQKSIKINFVHIVRIWIGVLYQINLTCLTPLYGECTDPSGLFQYQSIFLVWFTFSPSGIFTSLNYFIFNSLCMGLPDLSGLFQYQINYFFVIPFSGACSNPSGLSNYFTRPVYSYIKSFYISYSPHPPFFLWLILLIPGLYGLRQININYTRLILYSRLIQCMFTKLSASL